MKKKIAIDLNGFITLYFKNAASSKIDEKNVVNVNNWGEVYKYLLLEVE